MYRDDWNSIVFDREEISQMPPFRLLWHIKDMQRWSKGVFPYGFPDGLEADEVLKYDPRPMPYSPKTFRMLVEELMRRYARMVKGIHE